MYVDFDPTATRAFSARTLKRFVEGPIAFTLLVLVVLTVVYVEYVSYLMTAVALLLCSFFVVQRFTRDMLENDTRKPLKKNNAACLLSFRILRRLPIRAKTSYELLQAFTKTDRSTFLLHEMGIEREKLLEALQLALENKYIVPFLGEAAKNMERFSARKLDEGVLLFTLFQRTGVFEDLLNSLDLSIADLEMIVKWERYHNAVWKKPRAFSPASLTRTFGGVGRKWVTGFNTVLDSITEDISQDILYSGAKKVTIHLEEMKDALHILGRKQQHNIIVTGEKGCGKHTFIKNIAYHLRKQQSTEGFAYTHVLTLKAEDLLSGAHDADAVLLQALKRAQKHGHYILVFEDIGLFLQSGDAKIKGVLSKFLQAKNINIIAITDTKDYHQYVKTDPALSTQFETIQLEPTSTSDTMSVLMEEYFGIEDRQHTHVTYKALKSIIDLADRFVTKGAFPGKAIDVLHDVVASSAQSHKEFITESNVREMISLKAHMDVSKIDEQQKDTLRNLEEHMKRDIVGQEHAIAAIANALKRAKADIASTDKPIGTFLFLGPTGVGKTQTAKTLAQVYFGSSENMIRMDMNEYSSEDSVQAVIGSTDPRYPSEGFLTRAIQDKPFSIILLDEIEKADKKVLNLFLQILDEGHLIDGQGVKTDFRNAIIIATSNAGAQFIVDFLQKNPDPDDAQFKKMLLNELIKTGVYSPEFLNRFDEVVLYRPLSREETVAVARMMITDSIEELERTKGIAVQIEEEAVAAIAERGYSQEFGVREMKRTITDTVGTYIADYMLNNDVKRGDVITIFKTDLQL